jgi:hypothetical protein
MTGMRMLTVVLLLLHAVAASAQPFVGDAVLTDVLASRHTQIQAAAPAVAMARDRQGVVIAWTMLNVVGAQAVHVARLDSNGRIVAPVTEVGPAWTANSVDAYWPSIAVSPEGTGFTLAWVERIRVPRPSFVSAVYSQLGADLKPSAPRSLTTMAAADVSTPAIVRSGRSTWISAGGTVWEIHANGSPGQLLDAGTPVTDMVAAADYPLVVSGQNIQTGVLCLPQPGCSSTGVFRFCYPGCRVDGLAYELRIVALFTGSAVRRFSFKSDSGAAIQSNGRDVLVAWMNAEPGAGGPVTAVRLDAASFDFVERDLDGVRDIGTFGPDVNAARPDIAVDDERYVVVWSTRTSRGDRDVVGASIDRAGRVSSFSIATSAADENDPSIQKTSSGNFLVAYELNRGLNQDDRRIATRFLRFNGRRRAVH